MNGNFQLPGLDDIMMTQFVWFGLVK